MAIQSGTHLGPYEIVSAIGAGGMGEVYRARDPKLGRDVAIKVLPEAFAGDAGRMARFQREAKVLASLSHPNIATIYGLEDSGSTRALVMELVEGPTLADRVKQGPIPVDEAVRIARQIADALEYAHEEGIIHRDLKPANIKVTPDDTVKVLDFGLAKAVEGDPCSIDIENSPTVSRMATQAGVLLGTAAYMSPEQAKGKAVDRRADIWAFGCVLYEMLTGRMAFRGETATGTLAAVIRSGPDWSALPEATPVRVRALLQRCFQKDPKQRLRDIGDARIALDEVLSGAADPTSVAVTAVSVPIWHRTLPWGVAALLFVTLAPIAFLYFRQKPPPRAAAVQRYEFAAPDPSVDSVGALSPDGTRLVLLSSGGTRRLWLRQMDSLEAHPIEGTEDSYGRPFWSPDSRFITFGTLNGKLKKIDTTGGQAVTLCDSGPQIYGGFWTSDGKIIFGDPARQPGLWEVPAVGGVASPVPGVNHTGDLIASDPVLLPDGRHFLYMVGGSASRDVYLGSLDNTDGQGPKKLLAATGAGYASSDTPDVGYLLFGRASGSGSATVTVMVQPFDLRKLALVGEPVPLAEQVSSVSVSQTGTLVYSSGAPAAEEGQLTLFDREGRILGTVGEPGVYQDAAFSPDGKRLAATGPNPHAQFSNLWTIDLGRGVSTRFTFSPRNDGFPVWSPDGTRVVFSSDRSGNLDLYQKLSNGGGEDELLFKSDSSAVSESWSDDGRFLLFAEYATPTHWVLPLDADAHVAGKPFVFVQKGVGIDARFSPGPQGRPLWVAYSSNESGRDEVYVRPFDSNSPTSTPPGGGKWQVSSEGGVNPRWNSNGKELFYVALDGTVMSVGLGGGVVFQPGAPKRLFKPKGLLPQPGEIFFWDASSDGKKFILAVSPSASAPAPPTRFTIVLNWPSLLKK